MTRLRSALTVAACLGAGMMTVHTEQRGSGPAPRQWWVAKATPGQYGTNKPHIKLPDLKARHKGQSTWMEVVVNDENYHAEYHQGAPGTKIAHRAAPRHARVLRCDGRADALHPGRAARADRGGARIDHQHSETNGVFSGGDRQRAGVVGGGESAELQESLSRQRAAAGSDARLHGHEGRAERDAGRVHRQQQTALQPVRGGERSKVQRAERGAGRSHVGAGDLGIREEPAAVRSRPTKDTFTSARRSGGSFSKARSATTSRPWATSRPAKATSSMRRRRPGMRRGSPARDRRAGWRPARISSRVCSSNRSKRT